MSRIERIVTSGTFELGGGSWDVDNNIWIIGDDKNVAMLDDALTAHLRRLVEVQPRRHALLRAHRRRPSQRH